MAKIFISHSSKDKEFVRKLSADLSNLGHEPWFDEWEIKVGECIVSKIEHGIKESDYIIIVLTENSVNSGWVEREWKTKYWDEINQGKTLILPALLEDCKIPALLQTKRYADFRNNYSVALVHLMGSISPNIKKPTHLEEINIPTQSHEITELITKFQSRTLPLSQCISEAYSLAKKIKIDSLIKLCEGELTGWSNDKTKELNPKHRVAQVFVSFGAQINMQYFGWGEDASNVIKYMENNPDTFTPINFLFPHPIATLEATAPDDYSNRILSITLKAKDIIPDFSDPNYPVCAYARVSTYKNIFESTRNEFTKILVSI